MRERGLMKGGGGRWRVARAGKGGVRGWCSKTPCKTLRYDYEVVVAMPVIRQRSRSYYDGYDVDY